jgi:hypothetical protein
MSIAPIVRSVRVKAGPAKAFELFTAHMGRWFPYEIGRSPKVEVVIEPRPQGRWFERDADGVETQWGEVLAWEPPGRVLLAWRINAAWAFDPKAMSEVEVTFVPAEEGGSVVTLEHRKLERLGADAERVAEELRGGWPGIFELFAQYADSRS